MVSKRAAFRCLTVLSTFLFACGTAARPYPTDINGPLATTADPTGTSIPTAAPKKWEHPGVFVSDRQLWFVEDKVKAGAQPWSQALSSMLADPLASPSRIANPYVTVECGPTSTPNIGCYDERDDSMAAYMNALAYWVTKGTQYANKAIYYMNAWSSTIKNHTLSNAPLQTAWSAANWVRAGELMRYGHTHHLWSHQDMESFKNMLKTVYIPEIINGSTQNGNWELGMSTSRSLYDVILVSYVIKQRADTARSNDGSRHRRRSLPRRCLHVRNRNVYLCCPRPGVHISHFGRTVSHRRPRHPKHPRSHHQILV